MAVTQTHNPIDANTDRVEYRQNGTIICTSIEPNPAAAATQAAKDAAIQAQKDQLSKFLDSGKANPTTPEMMRSIAVILLSLMDGPDAALVADSK